jgi:hypothetical protein
VFRVGGSLEQVATRYYDRAALGPATGLGSRDRQPVRLDHRHPPGTTASIDRFGTSDRDRRRGGAQTHADAKEVTA